MFNLFKKKKESGSELDTSCIVPRLKLPGFLTALKTLNIPDDQLPATESFVGELLISYAFDLPSMFQMVTAADVERLGISKEELHRISVENLREQLRAADVEMGKIEELPTITQLVIGDNLEACSMLDLHFWQKIASNFLEAEPVVVAPHRDMLLFTRRDSQEGIETLRVAAKNILEGVEDNHGLCEQLMILKNDHWELFAG